MTKHTEEQERIKLLNYATKIMEKGEKVYYPSKYWSVIAKKNNEQLVKDGFENIKIRQGLDYFQFLVFEWSYWQFQYVWKRSSWSTRIRGVLPALTSPRFAHFPMEDRQRWLFVYYHFLLWDYVKRFDDKNFLSLEEPSLGNPLLVKWRGHVFTQDLLNSIIETYSVLEALLVVKKEPKTILELGGGYGRNTYVLKKLFPKTKIIMVDIVPAIVLAQWYMTNVFADKNVLGVSDFKSYTEIKNKYEKADMVFLLPHQIELLPKKSIDMIININSFQEMTLEQIKSYFKQIDRLTNGIFYTKQWKQQHNKVDNIKINENEYPVYKSWVKLFHREARVQSKFYEAAYQVK